MTLRNFVHGVGAAILLTLAQPSVAFELVTAEEVARDREAPRLVATRSLPNPAVPRIELLVPELGRPLNSPVDIKLRWTAAKDASIDVSSVRVKYGRLGIDVTERLLGAAKVTPMGIDAPGAKLPAGEHRLAVEVADDQRRLGRREFVFEILDQ